MTRLNHLLQYLQGRVFGFGSLTLPLPSTLFGGPEGGGDCMESILSSVLMRIGGNQRLGGRSCSCEWGVKWPVPVRCLRAAAAPVWNKRQLQLVWIARCRYKRAKIGGLPLCLQKHLVSEISLQRP